MPTVHVTMRNVTGWELQFLLNCDPGTMLQNNINFELAEEGCRPVNGILYGVTMRPDATGAMLMISQEPNVQSVYAALQNMSRVSNLVIVS